MQDFAPTSYHGVTTPSGVYNQMLKGIVANDTGATVTYSANSGFPIPADQACWSFTTGTTSTDWLMTIDADGHYTLNCHLAGDRLPARVQGRRGDGKLRRITRTTASTSRPWVAATTQPTRASGCPSARPSAI